MEMDISGKDNPGVLKEIDCFITPNLQKELLLLLYKNRDRERNLEMEYIEETRIKPNLDLLEIKLKDGRTTVIESSFEHDSYLLRSNMLKLPKSLVGYFVNDECHFVPLKRNALVLDTYKEPTHEKLNSDQSSTNVSHNAAPGMVVSARLKTSDINSLRGPMGSKRKPADTDPDLIFLNQQSQAPWRTARYKRFTSHEAFERRIPLLYPNDEPDVINHSQPNHRLHSFGLKQDEYISNLLSGLAPEKTDQNKQEIVKSPTLEELIHTIVSKAHVIRFSKLILCARERFKDPHQVNASNVLPYLQKFAVLVRGWWVIKSEILYPSNTYSEHSAVPSILLVRARDYILAVFHRGEHLTRKTISSITKLPTLEATEILKPLACKMSTPQKGYANHWEFHPTDHEFIRKHPDIVQQQQTQWELRIKQLCTQLKLEHLVSDGVRIRRRSNRKSSESTSESENEFPSLVSGVHISTASKRIHRCGRKRQLSLSQTSDNESNSLSIQPLHKRARTLSLSNTYTSDSTLPSTLPRIVRFSNEPTIPGQFCTPISPPPIKSIKSSVSNNVNVQNLPDSSAKEVSKIVPITPTEEEHNIRPVQSIKQEESKSTLESSSLNAIEQHKPECLVFCKSEPPSHPNQNISEPMERFITQSSASLPSPSLLSPHSNNHAEGNHSYSTEPNHNSKTMINNNLINFVQNILNTQPIICLSGLAKMYQQQLGSVDPTFEVIQRENGIPPGSESERTILKTRLLKTLSMIDARQLSVRWPTISTSLEEEPLFVKQVAGPECGAINESIAQFRDNILDLYESMPSFKMRDLQEKCAIFPPKGMSEKQMRVFLKQYCTFRHGRYFLRYTVSEDK